MYQELKDFIQKKNNTLFSFSLALNSMLDSWSTNTMYEKALYTCLNGFAQSARNYALSVIDDLSHPESNFMPKAMMNRLLLRNCLEAYLIGIILEKHPEYSEKYYATKADDRERIELLYSNSENEKHFLKRFEWLPRIKGRKATSTKDLLKYIQFDDQEEIDYVETLIKNLDTFIHPSFRYSQTIYQPDFASDVSVIYSLFVDEGLIDELKRNIYGIAKNLPLFPKFFKALNEVSLMDDYLKEQKNQKSSEIPLILHSIAQWMKSADFLSYKGRIRVYLLYDLIPRYDDLLKSAFQKNDLLFFIQSRYIIESLATINVLMDEDEQRNQIYYVHQSIKSFEAQQSSQTFFKIKNDTVNENQRNIELIKEYYRKHHQAEIDDVKISRLSGWALFLKNLNNTEPLNSPHFVNMLGNAVFPIESDTRRLMVIYEESNAYTHITPYAFSHEKKEQSLYEVLLLVNELLNFIIHKMFNACPLDNKTSVTSAKNLELSLAKAIARIKSNKNDDKSIS